MGFSDAERALPKKGDGGQAFDSYSGIAIRVRYANLPALIETSGVLNASTFAVVFRGPELLLVCAERPCQYQNDQADKHGYQEKHILDGSPHVILQD